MRSPVSLEAQDWQGMKVTLAAHAFTSTQLQELQPVADEVTRLVDTIIPGKPQDYPTEGIVCFEAPARWKAEEFKKIASSPPVTFSGAHVFDEPAEALPNTLRIALNEVPEPNRGSLAFQLAHELAHVKMGSRTDNYLDETFAVALSLEVLHRLGYEGYLLESEGAYLKELPPALQEALAGGRWQAVRIYWRNASKIEAQRPLAEQLGDRPFQMLGALLILQNRRVHWSELLNASLANACSTTTPKSAFAVCAPDVSRMNGQRSFLQPLGFKTSHDRGKP